MLKALFDDIYCVNDILAGTAYILDNLVKQVNCGKIQIGSKIVKSKKIKLNSQTLEELYQRALLGVESSSVDVACSIFSRSWTVPRKEATLLAIAPAIWARSPSCWTSVY